MGVGRLCGNIQGGIGGVGRAEATGTAGRVYICEKGKEAKASPGSGGLACPRPTAHPWGETGQTLVRNEGMRDSRKSKVGSFSQGDRAAQQYF